MIAAHTQEQKLGLKTRLERKEIHRKLQAGELDVFELLGPDAPACVANLILCELLLMGRGIGRRRLEDLNRIAVRDGVNLMIQVHRASERTKGWLRSQLGPISGPYGYRSFRG